MDELAQTHPDATITTERELRTERHRATRNGTRDIGRGRMPDGLVTFPDGRVIAIELDLTPKRAVVYARIVRAFGAEPVDAVHWYVMSERIAERLRRVVTQEFSADRITVSVWRRP